MFLRISGATFQRLKSSLGAAIVVCFLAAALPVRAASTFPRTVQVEDGAVSGLPGIDPAVTVFKGIPFAAPPVGELRWKPPIPPAKWSGVLEASHFSPSCPQVFHRGGPGEGDPYRFELRPQGKASEDCLYLNVWTPANKPTDKLPVLVWIYGGGFQEGSTSVTIYDGLGLATKGVVVVSMNYRLGIFGFLASSELDKKSEHHTSGNYGTLDQIAALRWVQKNIAAFGGDPDRVAIFGQSAGGGSVQFLSISPLAKGLFRGAVSENGTLDPNDPFLQERSPSAHKTLAQAEQDDWKYLGESGIRSLDQLRQMTTDQIEALPNPPFPPAFFAPNIDGWVLPQSFGETYAEGKQLNVAFMAGWTSSYYPHFKTSVARYRAWAEARYGSMAKEFLAIYPASTDEQAATQVEEATRDSYRSSLFLWAVKHQKTDQNKIYLYYFNHPLPDSGHDGVGAGAAHELPYVFNSLYKSGRSYTNEDYKLADMMSSLWSNFAAHSDPNGPGLPEWRPFDPNSKIMMQLGDNTGPIPVADEKKFDFFERFFATKPAHCGFGEPCSIDVQ
jgi:carboxylesterase type B